MTAKQIIFLALGGFTTFYLATLLASLRKSFRRGRSSESGSFQIPSKTHLATGFITNFFDTLGIGSFATTTSVFKFMRMVPDRLIPGTLNVGHTLPVIFQAFVYILVVEVDVVTLTLMIVAAVIGAWFGAGLVAGLSRRAVQIGMSSALLLAAVAMFMSQMELFPIGGNSLRLEGWRLPVGMAGNFIFGAVSTLGVGFYAPCMTLVSLLGMNPAAAFPIMMGSSAFLMPVASVRFLQRQAYSRTVAVGLAVGGLLGVPLAAFVVKSLPLFAIRWLVIMVVLYAAILMLRSALEDVNVDAGKI
ncbi:MAG: sulfite exporter TauE/SafE family protein [Acidobacteria bacterium]|nr:sulfite exporter TauE/SafE family protein [Acidobacteriota bacterium]MDA1234838.1 sulfite exporter TauE/SafE family protein [Acidobacteriota bacterium]